MVAVTRPVAGSSLDTVRSSELATHTAAGVTAMPAGPVPTDTGPLTSPVSGSIRETVPSWLLATQTACGPTAMPSGQPADLDTVSCHGAGHGIDPVHGVVALVGHPHAAGPAGDGDRDVAHRTVCTTVFAVVLIRDTVPSPLLVTHTSAPVTVTAVGAEPTGMVCTTAWVAGLIRNTVPSALSTAQTEPSP